MAGGNIDDIAHSVVDVNAPDVPDRAPRSASLMREVYVADVPSIVQRLGEEVAAAAGKAIAERGLFAVALAGGSVATECFPALAALPLPRHAVHFFWADERAVSPTDPESNFGVANRLWLTPAGVPAASIHRMHAEREDLTAAAEDYASVLSGVLGPLPALDIALLGMGPDGHIASLFPDHPLLRERERVVAAVTDSPKPPPQRLTLTLPSSPPPAASWSSPSVESQRAERSAPAGGLASSGRPVAAPGAERAGVGRPGGWRNTG